jgi:hypothetical protein
LVASFAVTASGAGTTAVCFLLFLDYIGFINFTMTYDRSTMRWLAVMLRGILSLLLLQLILSLIRVCEIKLAYNNKN